MYKFKFADIGEGLHEGLVGEIYVKENQKINEGDSLFSVETDKITTDIPSPVTGTVTKILITTGETVHVGEEVFFFEEENSGASDKKVEAKKEDESASVVGDIKVSNDVLSFDVKNNKTSNSKYKLPNKNSPMPEGNGEKVDVVIIGAGPGGYDLAARLGKLGYKTVSIEDRFAGGVCLNIGCIPTKALLKDAKLLHYMKEADQIGLELDSSKIKINWTKMQERKEKISNQLKNGVESLIKSAKAEYVFGHAEILDKNNVEVNGRIFTTKYIVIASGSRPITLNLDGFEEGYKSSKIVNSTGALEFKEIPESLAIIGGGVIGVEFATLFNELGTKVTIFEGQNNILRTIDGETSREVSKLLTSRGIEIITNAKVVALEDEKLVYEVDSKKEKESFDKILVSVGRISNNLNIDKIAGVKLGKRGEILVNEIMQTNVENIFAIGDAVGNPMLAHTAYRHSKVLTHAFEGHVKPFNVDFIPGCIYIYPEISFIGKSEEQLKSEKVDYIAAKYKNSFLGRALAENDTFGFTKLLVDKKYGKILGAHIINSVSSEMITEIASIMELEGTVYELADIAHPHPSISEGIWEAANHAIEKLKK